MFSIGENYRAETSFNLPGEKVHARQKKEARMPYPPLDFPGAIRPNQKHAVVRPRERKRDRLLAARPADSQVASHAGSEKSSLRRGLNRRCKIDSNPPLARPAENATQQLRQVKLDISGDLGGLEFPRLLGCWCAFSFHR